MDGVGDKPTREPNSPEQRSTVDGQRTASSGGQPPQAAEPRQLPLETRLQGQRRKLIASINTTCRIGLLPLGCVGWCLGYFVFTIGGLILIDILSLEFSGRYAGFDPQILVMALPFLTAVAVALVLLYPLRLLAWRIVRSAYRSTWQAVEQTDVLLMIAQEDQHQYIRQQIDETFGLRWVSPPIPRTFEQHLEYAACYFQTYLTLIHRAELTTRSTLLNGSLPWFVGQRSCCAFGILAALGSQGWCTMLWLVGGGLYLQRLGRELALVDSLIYDVPQPLQPARHTSPRSSPGG